MTERRDLDATWTEYARERLAGRTIRSVRYMTAEESAAMSWSFRPLVLELDDGALIYPARDDEGNDGGALFGVPGRENGDDWLFPVLR